MKKLFLSLFCVCLMFSFSFSAKTNEPQKVKNLNYVFLNRAAEDGFPNIFRPIGNLFKRIFRRKPQSIGDPAPNVINVELSQAEVIANCPVNSIFCLNNKSLVEVSTEVQNFENDVLTYSWTVSGGKIIGLNGRKIVKDSASLPDKYTTIVGEILSEALKVNWDLTDVKPGTYTITAAVDDGCGFCGKTVTKTITVKECPDCKTEK